MTKKEMAVTTNDVESTVDMETMSSSQCHTRSDSESSSDSPTEDVYDECAKACDQSESKSNGSKIDTRTWVASVSKLLPAKLWPFANRSK